jgi:hypothetical protein
MKTHPITIFLLIIFLAIIPGCTLPGGEQAAAAPTTSGQLETMVAMTLAAFTPSPAPVTETPAVLLPSPTKVVTASATVTPTFSTPMLTISEDTNCRSGPGQSYQVLTVLRPGTKVEVTGRYQNNSYWVIKMPNSSSECWMWGEFATPEGSYASMPEMTPPATATAAPPAPPRAINYDFFCTFTDVTVNMTWTDMAFNEQGYRIYRNTQVIVELPANATAYTDVAPSSSGAGFTYMVEAYNASGTGQASITFNCP